ncbi:MAG: thioredoxin-disulfide reductase [Deltaproteobacteria bacterium RBG_19FT_COMBO_46_12]|nr:MAG: thioredoxin-disulfide reductase [Deltaproteobacteria bacterium RBG_19FT_COMBO_46_12]
MMEGGEIKKYDVIIIGGGPAGLTAGLYTSRSRLNTLLIEIGLLGGQMTTTEVIENYSGFPQGITGDELSRLMEEQARRFGLEVVSQEAVEVKTESEMVIVKADDTNYHCKVLIICTGNEWRKLGVPGEKEFTGKGVSYCATCDATFFQDAQIIVVGGGDSALTEALYLTKFAREVTIIHRRDALRGTKVYQERVFADPKIKLLWNSVVQEIRGDSVVQSILVKNVKTGEIGELKTEGVFLFVGLSPKTQFLKGLVKLDEAGYILTSENCETSVKGIFAAGDCRKKLLRQIATAVGDGATAAFAAEKFMEERK